MVQSDSDLLQELQLILKTAIFFCRPRQITSVTKSNYSDSSLRMFFSNELLLGDGAFAIIWLMGQHRGPRDRFWETRGIAKVSKAKILSVDVIKLCKDVDVKLKVEGNHISLRMAATLTLGIVRCHQASQELIISLSALLSLQPFFVSSRSTAGTSLTTCATSSWRCGAAGKP